MILKFVKKSIAVLQYHSLIKNSSVLFCQNNKGSGFNKFQRKKVSNNQTEQQPKDFQNQPQQQKKKDDSVNSTQSSSSFKSFNRKKISNIQNKVNIEKKQKQQKKQSTSSSKMNSSFVRFDRKKPPPNKQIKSNEQVGPIKQKPSEYSQTQHKSAVQDKELKNQQKINQTPYLNMKQNKEQSKKDQNLTKIKNQQKEKPTKTLEQIQKQRVEEQISNKQKFFKQKIQEYKSMKSKQNVESAHWQQFRNSMKQMQQKIGKKIFKVTGIDIMGKINPPQFVGKNPMLSYLFSKLFNYKFLIFCLFALGLSKFIQFQIEQISSQQFIEKLDTGLAFRVVFQQRFTNEYQNKRKAQHYAFVELKNGQTYKCISNNDFQNYVRTKIAILNSTATDRPPIMVENQKASEMNFLHIVRNLLNIYLLFFFISSISSSRKGQGGNRGSINNLFQQSKSKRFQQKVYVRFNDVVGMQKAKQQIVQFIDFLMYPEKYHKLGAKIPRGALLTGPPGTGKTMIAKACAGQSNVPFFTISGSQFMEMYVGVGAQRVRDLFKEAKQAAPSIIFIDEIDAVGKKRAAGFGGGNDQRDNTLNQLLVQMDGFNTDSNVIVFAATNQKQVLDSALTRPGRFDRLIEVDLPDIEGRKQIFMVHLKPIVIDSKSSIEQYARRMATLTPGFSGADIKNLCNEAAIMAARNQNKFVTLHDFELATQRVIGGVEKKSHLITPETRRIVAYHQCGHGVVSWFLQGANPLLKLTIIPRSKGSLGFAQYLPHETQISTKKQLEDQICVILAGRVTEQIFFSKVSTGAYDDLQKAYSIAKMIVAQHGMNEKLGWLSFEESQYAKYYSKETEKLIDEQILKIIKKCTQRTRQIITQRKQLIEKLAQKLLEVQTIDLSKISEILGERPFKPNKQYQQYLKEHKKMTEESSQAVAMKGTKFSTYIL